MDFFDENIEIIGVSAVIIFLLILCVGGYWYWRSFGAKKNQVKPVETTEPKEAANPEGNPQEEPNNPSSTPPYLEGSDPHLPGPSTSKSREDDEPEEEEEDDTDDRVENYEQWRFEDIEKTGVPAHNPFVEDVFRVDFKEPVVGQKLIEGLNATHRYIDPKIYCRVYALEINSNEWSNPEPIGMYSSVFIIFQLASPKVVLDENSIAQINQFKQGLEIFFEGTSDDINVTAMAKKAKVLGSYIERFGNKFAVYLCPKNPISAEEFGKKARKLGLKKLNPMVYERLGEQVQSKDGKFTFHRRGDFRLVYFSDQALGIVLNVPLIPAEKEPLKKMMAAANALAGVFNADLVDSNGNNIDGLMIEAVRKELDKFYEQMSESNLVPGSEDCYRLFA